MKETNNLKLSQGRGLANPGTTSRWARAALVLATNNKHKVGEIKAILRRSGLRLRVLTLDDFPKRRPVVENRSTIEGNAVKKAVEVARATRSLALADDTGLFVRSLKGRPGVYSARFAGPGCNFEDNNRKLLRLMKEVPPARRDAEFRCAAALADPAGNHLVVVGKIKGKISESPRGKKGFGYDPVFIAAGTGKTFAEMSARAKNAVSHRGRAFRRLPYLLKNLPG